MTPLSSEQRLRVEAFQQVAELFKKDQYYKNDQTSWETLMKRANELYLFLYNGKLS